jgi:hypothetical protein
MKTRCLFNLLQIFYLIFFPYYCHFFLLVCFSFKILNYKFTTKIIMFQEALQFKDFFFCYSRQNIVKINGKMLPFCTSHVSK